MPGIGDGDSSSWCFGLPPVVSCHQTKGPQELVRQGENPFHGTGWVGFLKPDLSTGWVRRILNTIRVTGKKNYKK